MKRKKKKTSIRFKDPSTIFFTLVLIVICFTYWTTAIFSNVRGVNLKQFAENRNTYSTILYAKRGTIYDKDSNVLALNVSSYTVIAYLEPSRTTDINKPNHVVDKEKTARLLSPLLNMSYEYILSLLNTKSVYQVELGPGGRGISTLLKEEIEDLNLPGIDFLESNKRYYPNGTFASYIVGYAKNNETYNEEGKIIKDIVGELGIEALYDEDLKGQNGSLAYEQDGNGYKIPNTREQLVEAKDGYDIYLTIDSSIQRFVEDAVSDAYDKYDPEWILFYVMDAKTGDILAGTSYPTFDPNILNLTNYENPLVSYAYEPGSLMKVYAYMCAIEKGTYDGNKTYESGSIEIEKVNIFDWNYKGWGEITYDIGLEYSSNVGAVNLINNFITKEDLKKCYTDYGFGTKTGIELPRELTGDISFEYPTEVASATFGQGISTTPIQHLQASTIIANDGYMLTPHIISKIKDTNKNEIIYEREVLKSDRIVSKETVDKIKDLMWNVVNGSHGNNTTGAPYKIDKFDIIGKTGSAEIYSNTLGSYSGQYIYSFSSMYPKEEPEIIVFTSVKKPRTSRSQAIIESFQEVAQNIAKYKNMYEESIENDLKTYIMDSYYSENVEEVANKLKSMGMDLYIIGDGTKIINQYPQENTTIIENDKIFLLTDSTNYLMPNLSLFSKSEVSSFFSLIKIPVEYQGNGFVVEQNIKEGQIIKDKVKVILKNKYIE
ncbi:MAG: penicillin-binding protein [Bacilli bacterium]|nr:penicillin-binding protein [Bacilli bacterium]